VDRAQVHEIIGSFTQKFGDLTEFDNTCLDEIVLRVRTVTSSKVALAKPLLGISSTIGRRIEEGRSIPAARVCESISLAIC
jgi:hypothetical protein